MKTLKDLIEVLLDAIESHTEDAEEYYQMLPAAASIILAQSPVGTGEVKGEPGESVTYLTATASGSKATVTIDYDVLPFVTACLERGIEELDVGGYVVFKDNPEESENSTLQEEKKVIH